VIAEVSAQPNGRFQYVLPDSVAQVKFEVNRPGIFPKSAVAELPAGKEVVRLNDTMDVVTLKAMVQEGKAAPIEVYFPTNGAQLDSTSYFNLQQLFELVKDRTWVLEISGHTDQEGAEPYNLRLSKERAESVSSHLRNLGLPEERLRPVGRGSGMPVAKNYTEAGRAKNRRVEIRLLLPDDKD
jgi:outer membrane protein OmpA-like peptidoglycan-associated protein